MKTTLHRITVASLSIIGGTAAADYTGLSYETTFDNVPDSVTIRVYADFDNQNDQLNAVYGDGAHPLSIESTTSFYQNPFGGPVSTDINPALFPVFPSLEYDSWVTIGLEDQVDNAMLNIGIDWTNFEAGGAIETSDGAWFATPDDAQVLAGAELRVLIGQFTSMGNDSIVSGTISMQGTTAAGDTWVATDVQIGGLIPAPGAVALLGLAALTTRRRRRS
jgi:hypothetical protein